MSGSPSQHVPCCRWLAFGRASTWSSHGKTSLNDESLQERLQDKLIGTTDRTVRRWMRLRIVLVLFLASVLLMYHKTLEHLRGSSSRRDNSEPGRFGGFWILYVPPGWSLPSFVQNFASGLVLRPIIRCVSLPASACHSLPFLLLPLPLALPLPLSVPKACEYAH